VLPLEDDPPWVASIEIQPTDYQELVAVRVSVGQQLPPEKEPAGCELVRWMPNPDYIPATTQSSNGAASNSATTSGSSSGSTSSGGQNTSGGRP